MQTKSLKSRRKYFPLKENYFNFWNKLESIYLCDTRYILKKVPIWIQKIIQPRKYVSFQYCFKLWDRKQLKPTRVF